MRSLLVTIDQFGFGGRETFLRDYLTEVRASGGVRSALLAGKVRQAPDPGIFERVADLTGSGLASLAEWTDRAFEITGWKADVVWAHHFALLPALALASRCRAGILPTFHGPLIGAARPNPPIEALGMALTLLGCNPIACVSDEVARSLVELGVDASAPRVLRNRVRIPAPSLPPSPPPWRFVLLTRGEKLGHIRAAISLLPALHRRLGAVELTVHSDLFGGPGGGVDAAPPLLEVARRLGRRWLARHPNLFPALRGVRFRPPTRDVESSIREAHVVMGMGRVVLEGLAAGRPTVLIGYEGVVGVVDRGSFAELRRCNFSGRGSPLAPPAAIARRLAAVMSGRVDGRESLVSEIDVRIGVPELLALLREAAAEKSRGWRRFAEAVDRAAEERLDDASVVAGLLDALRPDERALFERLVEG